MATQPSPDCSPVCPQLAPILPPACPQLASSLPSAPLPQRPGRQLGPMCGSRDDRIGLPHLLFRGAHISLPDFLVPELCFSCCLMCPNFLPEFVFFIARISLPEFSRARISCPNFLPEFFPCPNFLPEFILALPEKGARIYFGTARIGCPNLFWHCPHSVPEMILTLPA